MPLLRVILLTCHLLTANVASIGPLVAVWLHLRGRKGDDLAWWAGRRLALFALVSLIAAYGFGFIQLGISWLGFYEGNWEAMSRISKQELGFIVAELVFSLACLAIYFGTWDRWRNRSWLHGTFALLGAANLLYHFPPLMAALGALSARPELSDSLELTHDALREVILRPEVLSLSLHFLLASIAVVGVAVMHIAAARLPENEAAASALIVRGAWMGLLASLLQFAVGMWVLIALPARSRDGLIGHDPLGTILFVGSILGAIALLHNLAGIALGRVERSQIRRSIWLLVAVVILMTGALVRSRELAAPRIGLAASSTNGGSVS